MCIGGEQDMIEVCFPYDSLSILDMSYLLSNYDGWCDADAGCVVIDI